MPAAAAAAAGAQGQQPQRERAVSLQSSPSSHMPPTTQHTHTAAAHSSGLSAMDTGKIDALPATLAKDGSVAASDAMQHGDDKGTGAWNPPHMRTNEDYSASIAHTHGEAHETLKAMEQPGFFQQAQHSATVSPTKLFAQQQTTLAAAGTKTDAQSWQTAFPPQPLPNSEAHSNLQHMPQPQHSQQHSSLPSMLTPPQWLRPLDSAPQSSSSAAHTTSTPWLDSAGLGQSLSPRLSHSFNSPLGTESMRHLPLQNIAPMAPLRSALLEPPGIMQFRHSSSLNLPMQARTIETHSMRGIVSMPTSRRPSLSRAPGEAEDEEQDDTMSQSSSRRGSFSFSSSMLSRGVMSMPPVGSSMLSPGSTAPASGVSSGATSPMRRFHFDFTPKIVATLVPRAPLTSLQIAGRNTEEERRKKQEADRMPGTEEEDEVDESDEAMDEHKADAAGAGATPAAAASASGSGGKKRSLDGAQQTAAARAKKLKSKKTRRALAVDTTNGGAAAGAGDAAAAGESTKKKKATSPLHRLASAAQAARMSRRPAGRRKSVPPTFFDELSSPAPTSASGASTGDQSDSAELREEEPAGPRSPSPVRDKSCELCKKMHAGTYGGGRFCSAHCARHFSIVQRWEKKQGRD